MGIQKKPNWSKLMCSACLVLLFFFFSSVLCAAISLHSLKSCNKHENKLLKWQRLRSSKGVHRSVHNRYRTKREGEIETEKRIRDTARVIECAGCSGSGRVHSVRGRSCSCSCWLRWLPWPQPQAPPYHLCLSHLKGWLLAPLLSPFVLLTNVAALHGEICKVSLHYVYKQRHKILKVTFTTYFCHNISIWHVQMIHFKFTAVGMKQMWDLTNIIDLIALKTIGWKQNLKLIELDNKNVVLPLKLFRKLMNFATSTLSLTMFTCAQGLKWTPSAKCE